mmetsp:Transcript_11451/g.19490  ORF Transcript_11451/g.19490 Transcript_11451/m.19490 type:complete len:127 (+) Transcript_11451:1663-2043(+)
MLLSTQRRFELQVPASAITLLPSYCFIYHLLHISSSSSSQVHRIQTRLEEGQKAPSLCHESLEIQQQMTQSLDMNCKIEMYNETCSYTVTSRLNLHLYSSCRLQCPTYMRNRHGNMQMKTSAGTAL